MSKKGELSRRSFLQGASLATVAAAGVGLVGCSDSGTPSSNTAAPDANNTATTDTIWQIEDLGEPAETLTAEVCIIGGGGTGLAAGVQAKQLGLDALVLEKHQTTGGSFIGTEGLFGVNSHWQQEAGETVTSTDVIQECMDYHHWLPEYELYKAFFNRTAETIDWLESIGVKFSHVQSLGDSHVCWHIYAGDVPGIAFMDSMLEAAQAVDLRIETSCSGKKLLVDDSGAITGVLAVRDDGTVVQVDAKVVILASGGYSNNGEFINYISGLDPDFLMASGMDGRDADGIIMGHDAGATLAHAPDTMMFYGPVCRGSSWTSPVCGCTLQPVVWINELGKRFVREDMFLKNFAFAGLAAKKQQKVYAVCTQALIDRFENGEGALEGVGVWLAEGQKIEGLSAEISSLIDLGTIVTADTLSELAALIDVDEDTLAETIKTYNEYCAAGLDGDFLKPAKDLVALNDNEGPYYAFDCQVAYFTTCGGLKVTEFTEVQNDEGQIIPGLYAGGCDTGGFYGDAYDVGIAAGSGASWAINSGRIAAEQAALYLGK